MHQSKQGACIKRFGWFEVYNLADIHSFVRWKP